MLEVAITSEMIEKAKEAATCLGKLDNSSTHGRGNVAGMVGELMVLETYGGELMSTFDFDILIHDHRIDVKTKRCGGHPLPHYEVSVAAMNTSQECDWYVFARVMKDLSRGWILGKMKKTEYFEKARFMKQGDIDESNNFRVKADCYNLAISELEPMRVPTHDR